MAPDPDLELGIFSLELRHAPRQQARRAARRIDALGFSTAWIPGGPSGGQVVALCADLLARTTRLQLAPAVLNIWVSRAEEVARSVRDLPNEHRARFVLALGASHRHLIERQGLTYASPVSAMAEYLDVLDRAGVRAVDDAHRLLAAMGPRMLALAADRSAGVLTYLTTPSGTAEVRRTIGRTARLIVVQTVWLGDDPAQGLDAGARHLAKYLERPNYVAHMAAQGFAVDTHGAPGAALVDAMVAIGVERIRTCVTGHFAAGADHVALQVANEDLRRPPIADWETLAGTFGVRVRPPAAPHKESR